MRCHIYDSTGMKLLRVEEKEPQCGDFCDTCGDCLHCYTEDGCPDSKDGKHYWVEYEDKPITVKEEKDARSICGS